MKTTKSRAKNVCKIVEKTAHARLFLKLKKDRRREIRAGSRVRDFPRDLARFFLSLFFSFRPARELIFTEWYRDLDKKKTEILNNTNVIVINSFWHRIKMRIARMAFKKQRRSV